MEKNSQTEEKLHALGTLYLQQKVRIPTSPIQEIPLIKENNSKMSRPGRTAGTLVFFPLFRPRFQNGMRLDAVVNPPTTSKLFHMLWKKR